MDLLAWLSQNLSYRMDLSSRDNMVPTNERRSTLLNLIQNVGYNPSRVLAAEGEAKIISIQTNQTVLDADGNSIVDKIFWNDSSNPDWFDNWTAIINAALSTRTKFGKPLRKYNGTSTTSLYRLNSLAPSNGVYPFTNNIGGQSLSFEICNILIDQLTGIRSELLPDPTNAFHLLYLSDGLGAASDGTGWFLHLKQGEMKYQEETIAEQRSSRIIEVPAQNVNQNDVWVTEINSDGYVVQEWTRVDDVNGNGVAFNNSSTIRTVFEVITRDQDKIAIRFGDGNFGQIPIGLFRIWYRTSSDVPRIVRTTDIQNRTLVIPYVANNTIYNLSLEYSLVAPLTNAAPTETDDRIKNVVGKVFSTQNRMVSGEDYNSFPLKDSSIIKIKSVNRTYIGHGLRQPINDPTGTYNNVKLLGEDGRLYKTTVTTTATFSIDLETTDALIVVIDWIQPALKLKNKAQLYYNRYDVFYPTNNYVFNLDSNSAGLSLGRIEDSSGTSNVVVPVGNSSSPDILKYLVADSVVRFINSVGPLIQVDYVTGDGTATSGVAFKGTVDTNSLINSIFPPFRQILSKTEQDAFSEAVTLRRSFAIRWDQPTLTWKVILAEDIDPTSEFSLDNTGDTTKASKDASWMAYLKYNSAIGEDNWELIDRGISVRFESDDQVDFYYADREPIIDDQTGKTLVDTVSVLSDNEARDSFVRRGLIPSFGSERDAGATRYVGDGVTKEFELGIDQVNKAYVFVSINDQPISSNDWKIFSSFGPDRLSFNTAPAVNDNIIIRYDQRISYGKVGKLDVVGDGATSTYNLDTINVVPDNVFVFINGLLKLSSVDYTTYSSGGGYSRIALTSPLGNNVKMSVMYIGETGPVLFDRIFHGDGSTTDFHILAPLSEHFVIVNGVNQPTTAFSTITTNPTDTIIRFTVAPTNGATVVIKSVLYPEFFGIKPQFYTATNGQTVFNVGVIQGSPSRVTILKNGQYVHSTTYTKSNLGDTITLPSGATSGDKIIIYYLVTVASQNSGLSTVLGVTYDPRPVYIGKEINWTVDGALYDDDGYTNTNGIEVTSVDADLSGYLDNPFQFKEFVIQDGVSDLVLWRRISDSGSDIWDPISKTTTPIGTYTLGTDDHHSGNPIENTIAGSIHYDVPNKLWLVADSNSGNWIEVTDPTQYKWEIGRASVKFRWIHYSPDSARIDSAPTNINDMFVLTSSYDSALRDWIDSGALGNPPDPPTMDSLRISYASMETNKMISDATIWRSARYKFLFGKTAQNDLQATFKVVRVPGSLVPDNDLKLRVLTEIDNYFSVDLWDFGETFYYTDLAAYIHKKLPSLIQSVVIIPTGENQKFGRLFQVRSEPDELFISVATADNIEIVSDLSDSVLGI